MSLSLNDDYSFEMDRPTRQIFPTDGTGVMKVDDICQYFNGILADDPDMCHEMAAITTLLQVIEHSTSETLQELRYCLQFAIDALKSIEGPVCTITSVSELFLRFITLTVLDIQSFTGCKEIMLRRGEAFYRKLEETTTKTAKLTARIITNGLKILTHSKCTALLLGMLKAASLDKIFEVYITCSSSDKRGCVMYDILTKNGVSCTMIPDSAIGYIMDQVDMVMVGAQGVAESGGVINKVGTYTMAMCAKEVKKPFYVVTESYKFTRMYPLNQADLRNEFKNTASTLKDDSQPELLNPIVDYTPPHYITLLITDLGILTPSAVSDELIKLYL